MTKANALATLQARLTPQGFVRWLGDDRPDAADLIAALGYWPQLRRKGRVTLDPPAARKFLASLGYVEVTAPREYILEGPGVIGFSHPNGDEYGGQLALDILEGRMSVEAQLHRASDGLRRATRETHGIKPRSRR